ncbi:MAG TPA: aminoglycoside phosphotransferase family protein [Terriglobia bacterium]|nr:aminoglycoside phosphotransferase family protein [Terriglobia bacterium]
MCSEPLELTAWNVPAYLTSRGLATKADGFLVQELGGGVSNIVLLVQFKARPQQRWVVKQSLAKLRVEDDWRSERDRIVREAEAIEMLRDSLGPHSLPEIVDVDRTSYVYVMTAAPCGSETWKSLLLRGAVDALIARTAGDLLGKLITAGRRMPTLRHRFEDRTIFDQLRIDPYYRTTAARHPELRSIYDELIRDSWQIRDSIVHGDYSPKNMLVKDGRVCLIDFEVVHWGDPAFDAAFLLNHLFLKACYRPCYKALYFGAIREFWHSLWEAAHNQCGEGFERMTMRHLGALMMARIDGKSPVEYITADSTKQQVRDLAERILLKPAKNLEDAVAMAQG